MFECNCSFWWIVTLRLPNALHMSMLFMPRIYKHMLFKYTGEWYLCTLCNTCWRMVHNHIDKRYFLTPMLCIEIIVNMHDISHCLLRMLHGVHIMLTEAMRIHSFPQLFAYKYYFFVSHVSVVHPSPSSTCFLLY